MIDHKCVVYAKKKKELSWLIEPDAVVIKIKQDNDVTIRIVVFMLKLKLSCRDLTNQVWSITKTRQENDMIYCTGVTYVENKTRLLQPIRLGATYAKNETRLSWSIELGSSLWQKLDRIMMWLDVQVQSTLKMILNYQDRSNRM